MSNSKGEKTRCRVCGFRIRGSNHFEGQHCNMGSKYNTNYRGLKNAPVGKK